MTTSSLRRLGVKAAVAALAAGPVLGSLAFTPAQADPKQFTSGLVGVGSDTTQDINDALTGYTNDTDFPPIHSSLATGRLQLSSWGAFGTACITPKAPGASFVRPAGSSAGRKALSRAIDGGNWGVTGDACGGAKVVSGLVDYARSSGVGSTAGTALTYIPFARDAVSYAYYTTGSAAAVTDLTRAELTSIYTAANGNGTDIVRGGVTTHVIPCGIQTSSGTFSFWNSVVAASTNQENTATGTCNSAGSGSRIEENSGVLLKGKGDAVGGNNQFIIGHSAGSFIAQSNGVSPSALAAGVGLGAISNNGSGTNLGLPYSGTAPNLAIRPTFYNDAVFGRFVYTVLDTGRVNGLGNLGLKELFVGSGSVMCSAATQETVTDFGFLSIPGTGAGTCGDTSTQRGLDSGSV